MIWASKFNSKVADQPAHLCSLIRTFYSFPEAVLLLKLWIFYVFVLSCLCYVFVCVCLYVLCGHLLGKGWPLGSRLRCLTVSVTFPLVSWVRCGTWLYRFLIFAPLLTVFVRLDLFFTSQSTFFCNVWQVFLGWTSTKQWIVSCSMTQHSDHTGGEARTSYPSIHSLMLIKLSHCAPLSEMYKS